MRDRECDLGCECDRDLDRDLERPLTDGRMYSRFTTTVFFMQASYDYVYDNYV